MTKFSDEERATIVAEARETVRRLANFKPQEIDFLAKWKAETDAQERVFRADNTLIYKTRDAALAEPAAPTPAPDSDERMQFIFDVVAACLAEERERHEAEIAALRDRIDDLKATMREPVNLAQSLADVRSSLADLRRVLDDAYKLNADQQRGPLDLPALPRRDFN